MKMTMTYEYITPLMAQAILSNNSNNRRISEGTVTAYANDMLHGNWDETVGSAISIDSNGVLRDGQHRLEAIVRSGIGVHSWVCRGVSSDGIYDSNRKRTNSDQISIIRPDLDKVYSSNRYLAVAKAIIQYNTPRKQRRVVTAKEIIDFTDLHKKDLDEYFMRIPREVTAKVGITVVHLALFMAFMDGVKWEQIVEFYDILRTGMSDKKEAFPIIAYRNYLKDRQTPPQPTLPEIGRCQYALKKFITGSCAKANRVPKDLIYPFPWSNEENK